MSEYLSSWICIVLVLQQYVKEGKNNMPYKHSKIQYGLPHEIYPKDRVCEQLEILKETIGLKTEPVAITFLFTEEEYLSLIHI